MEALVGGAALDRAGRGGQPLDVLLQALEIRGRGPVGRQLRHGGRHGGPVVGEVAQLVDAERTEPVEQATVRRPAHERPAVASPPRLHEPRPPQAGEGLAQGDGRHAELGGEVALRRQLVALAEDPAVDRVREPALDLRHAPPADRAGRARCAGWWRAGGWATSGEPILTDDIWVHRFDHGIDRGEGSVTIEARRPETTDAFVAEWRNAAYNCYSSGHKFCREVCPVQQVTRNESWTPTAFHANVVAMEQGELTVADVAEDFVNCTQCGACELRCPNTLFTGDFYRFRTRTVDLVKAVRALAVDQGIHQPGYQRWNLLTDERRHEPVLDVPVDQDHVADWADGLDLPVGGETILFVDCEAAFHRTSVPRAVAQLLKLAGVEFGLMREQWCCGGPAAEMGYVDQAMRFARHNLDDWRAVGAKRVIVLDPHDYITFTEDYPRYFGTEVDDLEIVLAVELLAELDARRDPHAERAHRAHDHLPRPVPPEQAQGHLEGAAGDPARDTRTRLPRRRPRHAVVVLLGRGRGPVGREAGADGATISDRRMERAADSRSTRSSARARGPSGR